MFFAWNSNQIARCHADDRISCMENSPRLRMSPIFSLEAKRCEKVANFRGSEIAKKRFVSHILAK
jgi:hypothetical protein